MKQITSKNLAVKIVFFLASFLLFVFCFIVFCSFKTNRMADDFLKQLGITKNGADEKITNGFLGGYVDAYGVKNAKNIALGNRKQVILDLLGYSKKHVNTAAYLKQYNEMRDRYKPKEYIPQTPEEMRTEGIARAKESVAQMEQAVKNSDANMKPLFQKSLEDAKKYQKEAEDPNNKQITRYTKNYPDFVKSSKENYAQQLAQWERKYPSNHMAWVKMRLQDFMDATKDIHYAAELKVKNGKKVFVNPIYERKDNRWKMAFRAGKEVVEPARDFVQQWIEEIK